MLRKGRDEEQDKKIDELHSKIDDLKDKVRDQKDLISGEKISLGYLLSHVKLTQLWAVIVIIASMIAGSGSITYQLANKKSDAQLLTENARFEVESSKMKMENSNLQKKIEEHEKKSNFFKGLESKEAFLSQYLNFLLAAKKCEAEEWNTETRAYKNYEKNKRMFGKVIVNLWQNRHQVDDANDEGVVIGINGDMTGATVKFLYDGTVWKIPPDFIDLLVD